MTRKILTFLQFLIIASMGAFLSACANEQADAAEIGLEETKSGSPDEAVLNHTQCTVSDNVSYSFKGRGKPFSAINQNAVSPIFKPSQYRYLESHINQKMSLPSDMQLDDFVIFVATSGDAKIVILVSNELPCPRAGCRMLFFSVPPGRETVVPLNMENAGAANFYSSTLPLVEFNNCGAQNFYFVEPSGGSHIQPSEVGAQVNEIDETMAVWSLEVSS